MRAHSAIRYADAILMLQEYLRKLRISGQSEEVALLDALGRVLARPVLADRDQPPFARSTRDGFACRARDLASSSLQVVGLVRAGEMWSGAALAAGQTIEIMTGAPLPPGADSVLMIEHVERKGDLIRLAAGRSLEAGDNYIPAGAEARAGATLIPCGLRVGPAQIAAASSAGAGKLRVYRRPQVAILSTGDELVGLDAQPELFQIRNSNSYSLAAQVLGAGAEPVIQPIAGDTVEALLAAVQAAIEGVDMLLLSGGVSMGKYDLVEEVLASLGARFFFTGVEIQPGKPVVFGEIPVREGPIPFFGLPGNPVSTMVTFALFAAPVLAALCGVQSYQPAFVEARLTEAAIPKPRLRRFLPARLDSDAEGAWVTVVPWQGSGDLAGTARANCLLVIPEAEHSGPLATGAYVRVLLS
jgi:molybdopterin molybdotransferase